MSKKEASFDFDNRLSQPVLESISALLIAIDENKSIRIFNPAAERLTGQSFQDVLGKPIGEIHPAFQFLNKDPKIDRTLCLGVPTTIENIEVKTNNQTIYIDLLIDPLMSKQSKICGASLLAFETSEEVHLRQLLAEQNEDLVALHQVSGVLLSTMDVHKSLFIICSAMTSAGKAGNDHAIVFLKDEEGLFMRGMMAVKRYDFPLLWKIWKQLSNNQHSLKGVLEKENPRIYKDTTRLSRIVRKIEIPLDSSTSLLSEVLKKKQTITDSEYRKEGQNAKLHPYLERFFLSGSFAAMPLVLEDEAIGVLIASSALTSRHYNSESMKVMEMFADQAALAIHGGLLFRRMRERARRDSLTGIYNHGFFQSQLHREILRVERYGGTLGLLLFDIDHFKRFNDNYGHQTGDALLKNLAKILQETVRSTDTCARYGGEEFVVILPQIDQEQGLILAERLRKKIASSALASNEEQENLYVTVSIGLAFYPENGRKPAELIAAADTALYTAKKDGRNKVKVYQTPSQEK